MEEFLKSCYCWIYPKDISGNLKEDILNKKLQNELSCGGCFSYVDTIGNFSKIAKIGKRHYGFCSEDCYHEWLLNPAAQYLAPINVQLFEHFTNPN
jgi:YHS domain-containing protein